MTLRFVSRILIPSLVKTDVHSRSFGAVFEAIVLNFRRILGFFVRFQ